MGYGIIPYPMRKLHSSRYAVHASTTGCAPLRGALINRGTRFDPEIVNQSQVVSLCFKRGPTTFGFMP